VSRVDEPTGPEIPAEELTEVAARQAELAVPAELVAGSAREYVRSSIARIKAGEAGILPVVGGLIIVSILFQSLNSNFLTAQNLVNLLIQAAVFALLGMGEVFVLLLGEIDLSVGYVAGRYRETVGRPTRGAIPLLGAAMTLLGALVIAAIQIGTGVDANVSFLVVRDAIVTSLIGAALAIPVLLGVRLVVRSALVDERRAVRRPTGARAVETP